MLFGPRPPRLTDPLLASLVELLRLGREAAPGGAEVYRSSMQLLLRLAREPWVQASVFPTESKLARLFAAENAARLAAPRDFVPRNLLANAWKLAWLEPLSAAGRAEFEALCSARGAEHLRAAHAGGKGVVLAHAHTAAAQLAWNWLQHAGFDTGITLWQWVWSGERAHGELRDPNARALRSARELHAAFALLRAGGLVHVFADGREPSRPLEVPFFGRRRQFATTFAELALRAGAPVLAVFTSLDERGDVVIDIEPLPRAHDVAALTTGYIDWLARQWRAHASNLAWPDVRVQLSKYPPLSKAAA